MSMLRIVWAAVMVLWAAGPLFAGEADPLLQGTTIIENEVSQKRNWAAGSYLAHPAQEVQLLLNTRPKDGDELSEKESKLELRDDRVIWHNTLHTRALHTWTGAEVLGKRVYLKVRGEFIVKPEGGGGRGAGGGSGGGGGGEQGGPPWWSNSLDVDIDVGGKPHDNSPGEDTREMEPKNYVLQRNQKGKAMLRWLPPQMKEKRTELKPQVVVRRSHDGVDLLDGGQSIFQAKALVSKDLTDKVLTAELPLEVFGAVKGDCVFTADLTFTDPVAVIRMNSKTRSASP